MTIFFIRFIHNTYAIGFIIVNTQIQKELDLIKESILQVVPAEVIYLFGSYAEGEPTEESDLDIYVVVPDDIDNMAELYGDILGSIREKTLFPMDLLVNRSSVFNRRKNGPTLQKVIAQKGMVIYAA